MALNPKAEGKRDSECTETNEHVRQSSDIKRNSLSAATSTTSNQNGDQTGCEEGAMPQQEASDRRKSGLSEARSTSNSPLPGQRPAEEQPRRHFQIPRKIKERKGLYQFLPPDSREFDDLLKILSSFYLDVSSRGIFSYSKARLIHNELLEKEFIEKRRELKQEGRTEPELVESYCFLFPDKSKLPWICEKGLSVGHTRVTTLGSPSMGVYLSKYSDLLQMNPFEAGACGDIVIFKVMRGRLKNIHENMPKSVIEPSPKFDCHVSKNASRVTSLLSYRAFELTQQYYFEFAFDEIKPRPRHVCPYAVVSFQYKGKEAAVAPMTSHRFNTGVCEGSRGPVRTCYTVWSGPLVNKGQELCQVCLRSSTRPYLPFKLSEKLELSRGMQLEQVKRKIPSVLFSWETYSSTREVLKCGMSCSLFEVVSGKPKAGGGSLSGLLHKLERDRMVLVKPLLDRGFLFLLSSAQMVNPNEQRGRFGRSLQALFIFQEPRGVVKYASRMSEPELLSVEPPPPMLTSVQTFIPALHYALLKLRSNPVKDLSSGVERQAQDFLSRRDMCHSRPSQGPDYKQNLDERNDIHPAPRSKPNMDSQLRSYIHGPASYILSLAKAKDMMERIQQPSAPVPTPAPIPAPTPAPIPAPASTDYSPVSDWGGSGGSDMPERLQDTDRRKPVASHSNGGQPHTRPHPQPQIPLTRMNQNEYDKDKMKQLLRLIQLHKKALVKEPSKERPVGGREAAWDPHSLKRKLAEDSTGGMNKHVRSDPQTNGEPSQAHGDDILEEGSQNLAAVMESMGIYDTDLRGRVPAQGSSNQNTQQLLKILLDSLNKAVAQGAASEQPDPAEPSLGTGRGETDLPELGLRHAEQPPKQDYLEEEAVCSLGSPMSTCSMEEHPHSSDHPPWGHPAHPDKPQTFPDPDGLLLRRETVEPHQLQPQPKVQPYPQVQPHLQVQPHPQAQPHPQVLPHLQVQAHPQVQPHPQVQQHTQVQPHLQPHLQVQPQPQAQPQRPCSSLDNILNQELHNLSSGIQSIMQSQHIYYTSHEPSQLPHRDTWLPNSSFSDFVSAYVTPVPVHGHVKILREKIGKLISQPSFQHMDVTNAHGSAPPPHGHYAPPVIPAPPPSTSLHLNPDAPISSVPPLPQALNSQPPMTHLPPPHCLAPTSTPSPLPTPSASKTKAHAPQVKSSSSQRPPKPSSKTKPCLLSTENSTEVYSPSQVTLDSPVSNQTVCSMAGSTPAPSAPTVDSAHASPAPGHASPAPAPASAPAPVSASAPASAPTPATNLLFSQLKPEVFSSLVEIFKDVQKNTVKFYIHPGDEGEESAICLEIKEYLQSLGNAECKPQSFLENSSNLDKLLIIIQNEDIAAHVHKIPALVSLKKCSTVSFAGVDSLDDVKNHTYNELFVSGGFIVSDEFVLNPDCITQERLQAFLRFLEEQSSPEHPWQWKVHCKSQKKLKELGRLNSNAMGLLNLLMAYQKKHLVEFLPYHECDTQSRQAPDLDCLVKLQAQHTQQRHMIFLTERRFEMFLQYSRNGIVIASIDDIMNSFHSLIGGINQNELPTPPSTVVNDECVEEDMSLDSDDDTQTVEETPGQIQEGVQEENSQKPPLPDAEEFRPPLPNQLTTANTTSSSGEQNTSFSNLSDLAALKTAISQFKANSQVGNTSPGGFAVNPHQSFLCPSTPWTSFPGYATSPAYPASPCSGTQEQDYRAPASAPTATPGSALTAGPLTGQTPLPLEVKPPPPPHLMHLYVSSKALSGSDPTLVGAGGAFSVGSGVSTLSSTAVEASPSPIPTVRAYQDPTGVTGLGYAQADVAQHSFTTGATTCVGGATTHQGDRTLSGPGNGVWGSVGNSTGEAPGCQGGGMAGPVSQSGEREWTDAPGSSTPGSQGDGNPMNCTDSHGVGIGIPSAATRGGSVVRPMPPTHGGPGGGYGCVGALPGQIDGSLRGGMGPGLKGGYRGRGAPPGGPWPRLGPGPGRGHERGEGTGGAPCSWGYPLGRGRGRGQDYYSDYTYSHNYSP